MSEAAHTGRSAAERLAVVALSLAAVAVPLVPGRIELGPLPLDAVTVTVPLAVLLSLPFLRRLGAARVPGFLVEVPALAFIGVALATIPFSQAVGSSALTLLRYVLYLLLAVTASAVAVRPANLRPLSWAVVAAGAVTVGQAAWQALAPSAQVASFAIDERIAARVIGSFGNPNAYAEFLVVALAIALSLALTERGAARWVAAGVGIGEAVVLALTYSRGSWIALAAGVAVGALLVDWRWLGAFVAGAAALLLAVPGGMSRLSSLAGEGGGIADRIGLWGLAVEMIRRRPLAGVGVGNYLSALGREVAADPSMLPPGVRAFTPHDSFLTIAAEIGLVGGAAFAWMVLRALRVCGVIAARLARGSREWSLHAAYTVGIVAFAVNAVTDNAFQNPRGATLFWLLLGLLLANGERALREDAPEPGGRFSWLWRMPRTRGRLLLDSPVGALVLGGGSPAGGADDLEPWEEARE